MFGKTILLLGNSGDINELSADGEWQDMLSEFLVIEKATPGEAEAVIRSQEPDCVLVLDSGAGQEPLDILEEIHACDPSVPVVFRSSDMTTFTAVRLIHCGAAHCLDSREPMERLRETLEITISRKQLQDKVRQGKGGASEPWRAFLVGDSVAMEDVAETIRLVGPRRCTVLITGETGTGKEMAARALHMASPRSRNPMVAINCSALPANLLEAELFGHTKGAFTGAANMRIGRFEQANQGTIFLDEIGDMPLELQAKLLRVLQDREIQRLGSSESIKIDVRVIAATNVDLQKRVTEGLFRADLFYRLNVVPLRMPSLRVRTTDIPLLANHFVRKTCHAEGIPIKQFSPLALSRLCASPWPGNVRQLENSIEMAVAISGDRDVLFPKDLGLTDSGPRSTPVEAITNYPLPASGPIHFDTVVSQFQLAILGSALRQSGGNKTMAAERLGIKRTTLIMKMRSLENSGYLEKVG